MTETNIMALIAKDIAIYAPIITGLWLISRLWHTVERHEKEIQRIKDDETNDIRELKADVKELNARVNRILEIVNEQRTEVALVIKELELISKDSKL